jgi:hypothetical protein
MMRPAPLTIAAIGLLRCRDIMKWLQLQGDIA